MIASTPKQWSRYVAIGDSFTEGMNDTDPNRENRFLGWADRLAVKLAVVAEKEGRELSYANLAIRGKLLADIANRQVDDALALGPDLVSIVGGGNDILRPKADIDALAAELELAIVRIRKTGADVLMATPTDPAGAPLVGLTRGRAATYIAHLMTIAQRHQCYLINQWGLESLKDWRMWGSDRIHMTPEGHARVAQEAFLSLGFDPEDADHRHPLAPLPPAPRLEAAREHAQWAREYVGPWVQRRLTGRSSGDGLDAKRPALEVVDPRTSLPEPGF